MIQGCEMEGPEVRKVRITWVSSDTVLRSRWWLDLSERDDMSVGPDLDRKDKG